MGFAAKILADSIGPDGNRLTTFELTYPRMIHAEIMTHRVFSRNAASSRAIPIHKLIQRILENPYIPFYWGKNQPGMKAREEIADAQRELAVKTWLAGRDKAVETAQALLELEVHKQLANRVLEPYQWYTVIATATDFENFFALRAHEDAQPEIQAIAVLMREALEASTPKLLLPGEWHLPLMDDRDELEAAGYDIEQLKQISVGRCCRVSYLTHDGKREPQKDIELCATLRKDGHMSPFEHVATPTGDSVYYGNFKGFKQYRKELPNEHNFADQQKAA